jgi:hypothetical protein
MNPVTGPFHEFRTKIRVSGTGIWSLGPFHEFRTCALACGKRAGYPAQCESGDVYGIVGVGDGQPNLITNRVGRSPNGPLHTKQRRRFFQTVLWIVKVTKLYFKKVKISNNVFVFYLFFCRKKYVEKYKQTLTKP